MQLTDETDRMQQRFQQVYEGASGPENINKFEMRDLRDIIREAGGMAAMGDGSSTRVSTMLSAAVTPTIMSSYAQQQTGVQTYSAPVRHCYASYSASPGPRPHTSAPSSL